MKKLFLMLVLLVLFSASVIADGGDMIFNEIGMDKPVEWDSWSKEERHDYLGSLGLSPGDDGKYQGDAGDLIGYFNLLGLEEPSNWGEMTFDEKKAYVSIEEIVVEEPLVEETAVEEPLVEEIVVAEPLVKETAAEEPLVEESSIDWFLYLLILIVCVVLTFFSLRFKKIVSKIMYYVLPLVLLVWSLFYPSEELFIIFGIVAEVLLVWLLFVKPLAVIFKSKFLFKVVNFRRQLGVTTFWFFFFHAVGLYMLYEMTFSFVINSLLWGFVAGVGLLVLFITSNNYSMNLLKKNWKHLHRLAYLVLFGVLLHSSLKTTMLKFYIVVSLFIVLKLVEWIKNKP